MVAKHINKKNAGKPIGLPSLAGHPTYHVNVIKLKWEIIWTGGLPHLIGLPHLPGVPHLHVNNLFWGERRDGKRKISSHHSPLIVPRNEVHACRFAWEKLAEEEAAGLPIHDLSHSREIKVCSMLSSTRFSKLYTPFIKSWLAIKCI